MSIDSTEGTRLNKMCKVAQDVTLGTELIAMQAQLTALELGSVMVGGTYTAVAGDATAGTVDVDSGLATAASVIGQVLRAGVVVTSDAALSIAAGVITLADGSTYVLTEDDVFTYLVF